MKVFFSPSIFIVSIKSVNLEGGDSRSKKVIRNIYTEAVEAELMYLYVLLSLFFSFFTSS